MKKISTQLRALLEQNPNVLSISEKSVHYTSDFKEWALEEHGQDTSADEIFLSAGIPVEEFIREYSRNCIKRWKKKVTEEGITSLSEDGRGKGSTGRPKNENLNDYSYEELLAIVEIQREVIEDLKKKKALAKKKK